jgi:hypothetical protein
VVVAVAADVDLMRLEEESALNSIAPSSGVGLPVASLAAAV